VVRDELKIAPEKFNVDGGAIAHGHPIGATGAILVTKVAHALARTGGRRAGAGTRVNRRRRLILRRSALPPSLTRTDAP
jgi:acetyl-CoA acetyltransferase